MTGTNLALTLLSVTLICVGQVLFKMVGLRLNEGHSLAEMHAGGLLFLAAVLYGAATLLWIYVLRGVPLTKAYPFMALSFVIVPIAGVVLFSEQVRLAYVAGAVLIVAGVWLTVKG